MVPAKPYIGLLCYGRVEIPGVVLLTDLGECVGVAVDRAGVIGLFVLALPVKHIDGEANLLVQCLAVGLGVHVQAAVVIVEGYAGPQCRVWPSLLVQVLKRVCMISI